MSTNLLRIIPTDPAWTPAERAAGEALAVLRDMAPEASGTTAVRHGDVTFVDQGGNFETLRCPVCAAELEMDWWHAAMEAASKGRFADLSVAAPCCAARTSLDELDYDWPAGFARFVLEATDPCRGDPTEEELARITAALGHPVRIIWARH